ncbi:B12-binding domain-containing protein [Streptomyces sp. SHP 1-2]|uniref:cobalamin B12-binding domain-containing protein n=1 Tax=Streptomyces sp. SHP 1-2 TaxID=2769489 RepID=UPI002238EBB2|nr:cobalamin-dependent protein [Streptomyces sp. SHP 1-2]MCW5253632.1 cobalamin B12-binding domain-containing protein [Streptomyces sp. SHP 1-2]
MTAPTTADGVSLLRRARDGLWRALAERDEHAADRAVASAVDAGAGAVDVLLEVIAPVQRRIGAEWAADRLTVAQEHAATALQERVVAALSRRVPAPAPTAAAVTVACVDGEWHALPARILAEVLRRHGHPVDFLGARVPTPRLIAHLHRASPSVLALSSSLPTRLPAAHTAITAAQATGLPVLVGGAAFGPGGRYARMLGADAWAPDARAAVRVLGRGLSREGTGTVRQSVEDLPHLADQEYTLVTRGKRRLVGAVLAGLEERPPESLDLTGARRERTAEDLAHIVDFLAAALYTDDHTLFTGFLGWTGGVLRARGVPSRVLDPALALLQEEVRDFPRALALLARGRAALAPRVPDPGRGS